MKNRDALLLLLQKLLALEEDLVQLLDLRTDPQSLLAKIGQKKKEVLCCGHLFDDFRNALDIVPAIQPTALSFQISARREGEGNKNSEIIMKF